MRLVWAVGAPEPIRATLEKALSRERTGLDFSVQAASSIQQIPAAHLANPGVIVLLDAFLSDSKGLAGVRTLREAGFRGPLYLFGEPAFEEAAHAVDELGLFGFFAPFERADLYFVAGLIQASIDFDGSIDPQRFISPSGRASSETIRSLKDFNAFSAKFVAFVARFGIEIERLRKVLKSLSLPHVKTEGGAPVIEHPFTLHYGMDPHKVVLAAPAFSRGASLKVLRSDYASVLASLKSDRPAPGAMFPEFHHLARATQNLVFLSGSSHSGDLSTVDPILLLTTLDFPQKDKAQVPSYFFSFVHVTPTEEMLEAGESPEDALEALVQETAAAGDSEAAPASAGPELLDAQDIDALLAEPKIVGDAPHVTGDSVGGNFAVNAAEAPAASPAPENVTPMGAAATADAADLSDEDLLAGMAAPTTESVTASAAPSAGGTIDHTEDSVSSVEAQALQQKLNEAMAELDSLRKISESMGADIKRLMKERRLPTTDRELRDSNTRLQEQVKSLQMEKVKLLEMVATRDKQIELMKVQIDTIKKEKAA
ncbi:MAG: hypothetical protein JST16_15215 [Bdellovibrionales bacterium]|nr:hypothetical protein [Bdellovibrionales bacterium]